MAVTNWSTVSLVKDRPEVIKRFVSWHLGLGAKHMHLFFDDPKDPCISMLDGIEQVTATACTDEFWRKLLGKPVIKRQGRRQNKATTFGYQQVHEGWVLNLDCDEFLHCPNVDVSAFLANQSDAVNVIRLRPAERILPDADGGFERYRLAASKESLGLIHQEFAPVMYGRSGFFGHLDGKSFIRAGLEGVQLRQHWPMDAQNRAMRDLDIPASQEMALLHRNAEGFASWRGKLEFRVNSVSIPEVLRGHLRTLLDAGNEDQLRDVHQQIFHIPEEKAQRLPDGSNEVRLEVSLDKYVPDYFPA